MTTGTGSYWWLSYVTVSGKPTHISWPKPAGCRPAGPARPLAALLQAQGGQHGRPRPCFNYSASKDEVRQPRERAAAELPENVRTKADLSITTCE